MKERHIRQINKNTLTKTLGMNNGTIGLATTTICFQCRGWKGPQPCWQDAQDGNWYCQECWDIFELSEEQEAGEGTTIGMKRLKSTEITPGSSAAVISRLVEDEDLCVGNYRETLWSKRRRESDPRESDVVLECLLQGEAHLLLLFVSFYQQSETGGCEIYEQGFTVALGVKFFAMLRSLWVAKRVDQSSYPHLNPQISTLGLRDLHREVSELAALGLSFTYTHPEITSQARLFSLISHQQSDLVKEALEYDDGRLWCSIESSKEKERLIFNSIGDKSTFQIFLEKLKLSSRDHSPMFFATLIEQIILARRPQSLQLFFTSGFPCSLWINSQTPEGWTPLMQAAELNDTISAQMLLQNIAGSGSSIKEGKVLVKEYLSRKTSRDGNTALHVAAEMGWIETITLLLDHGADQETKNIRGFTPLDRVLHDEVKKILTV